MWRQEPRAIPQQHHQRAIHFQAYSTQNLHELSQFRNRLGLEFAFVEDNLLQGMLAARSGKGIKQQLKKEAMKEAQAAAAEATQKGEQVEAVRSLIGPRGGLPSLKSDLLKLAALLMIPVDTKMTNEELKNACRPIVAELLAKGPTKAKTSSSSTSRSSTDHPPMTKAPSAVGAYQKAGFPTPSKAPEPGISASEVQQLLAQQEQRFQSMLNGVFQHMMTPGAVGVPPISQTLDATMGQPPAEELHGWSQDEIQQMNRDYYEQDAEWRTANGIPPRDQ